jgi:hypothetical protein
MTMNSTVIHAVRGAALTNMMRELHANPRRKPASYHSVSVEPNVAMLVEPLNADPFVFTPPSTVHTFVGEPGSGTDRLRQRINATLYFHQVVRTAQTAHREPNHIGPFYVVVDGDQSVAECFTLEAAIARGQELCDAETLPATFHIEDANGTLVRELERSDGRDVAQQVHDFEGPFAMDAPRA